MKVLFIGGTGNISGAVSRLAVKRGIELYHLNRGITKNETPGVTTITGDISNPAALAGELAKAGISAKAGVLAKHSWDAVVDWVAFTPSDIERALNLFQGKTRQYIFISSASVYQRPPSHPVITESTPLYNPFWEYSRNKIACEERLNQAYRNLGFPMTIVRPSSTYDKIIPVALAGFKEYTIIDRILRDQKIIVHGDGSSLWTVTHADDFAAGFLGLIGNPQAIGQSFHITSDEILTWNQIYTILAEAVGKTAHIVHIASDFICRIDPTTICNLLGDKSPSLIFDNTKIKTFVPEFKAVIPFHEGIRRTLTWFDANPDKKIVNPKTNEMMDRIIKAHEGL